MQHIEARPAPEGPPRPRLATLFLTSIADGRRCLACAAVENDDRQTRLEFPVVPSAPGVLAPYVNGCVSAVASCECTFLFAGALAEGERAELEAAFPPGALPRVLSHSPVALARELDRQFRLFQNPPGPFAQGNLAASLDLVPTDIGAAPPCVGDVVHFLNVEARKRLHIGGRAGGLRRAVLGGSADVPTVRRIGNPPELIGPIQELPMMPSGAAGSCIILPSPSRPGREWARPDAHGALPPFAQPLLTSRAPPALSAGLALRDAFNKTSVLLESLDAPGDRGMALPDIPIAGDIEAGGPFAFNVQCALSVRYLGRMRRALEVLSRTAEALLWPARPCFLSDLFAIVARDAACVAAEAQEHLIHQSLVDFSLPDPLKAAHHALRVTLEGFSEPCVLATVLLDPRVDPRQALSAEGLDTGKGYVLELGAAIFTADAAAALRKLQEELDSFCELRMAPHEYAAGAEPPNVWWCGHAQCERFQFLSQVALRFFAAPVNAPGQLLGQENAEALLYRRWHVSSPFLAPPVREIMNGARARWR